MSIQSEITRITAQRDAMAAVLETTPPAPAALSRCSEVLETLRQALAANLVTMGVEAAATESLEVLVPKVLRIPQGDISVSGLRPAGLRCVLRLLFHRRDGQL